MPFEALPHLEPPSPFCPSYRTSFELTVSGSGLGDDELTAYTTVRINVKDVNDQAPRYVGKEISI